MQYVPNLGETPAGDARRDAVHVSVAPVIAGQDLEPGQHVEMEDGQWLGSLIGEGLGIVDPFLPRTVKKGDRFWLFLYPGTVTSLRHVWTHHAFTTKAPGKDASHD